MSYGDYQPNQRELVDTAADLILKGIWVDGCLECHLAPNAKGYCNISIGGRDGIKIRAHRLIWLAAKGSIPDDLFVLHSCDNRRCILDDHLFLGTALDNTEDMMKKGRHKYVLPGQRVDSEAIRALHQEGHNRWQIADMLFISPNTVWNYISPKGPYYGR